MDVRALLKDAGLAAFVTFMLALPMIGFQTVDVSGGVGITVVTRFGDVAISVVLVFFGRLALSLLQQSNWRLPLLALSAGIALGLPLLKTQAHYPVITWLTVIASAVIAIRAAWLTFDVSGVVGRDESNRMGDAAAFVGRWFGPVFVVFALIFPFLPTTSRYVLDLGILVLTYVMLGWGLNVVVGLAGLLDLGYVAFYAVGAYSYAIIARDFGLTFWACLPLAGLFAAFFGVILGFPVLRLRGDYLAIVTLGFGEIIRIVLLNWTSFSGGPNGISGVPRPSFLGMPFHPNPPEGTTSFHQFFNIDFSAEHRIVFLYYLILVLALVTNFFTLRIRRLPIGRAWEALREDEIACRALGINPTNTKLTAFAIGAMFAGFAGAFFATRQGFISPESFSFIESAVILAIVVLGGMGSQIGVVLAAILLIGIPEFFRELAQFRMLAFGAAMVGIMIWRPRGLLAHRDPSIRLADSAGAGR
ncbi:MAG: high-affinity branched-chain amino acid ABC transporter permease LivM [Alphaproteobacteria bacterium]|nr:high-affinity branched-chain amino acid ABC transporter permease LivM [Alphaproteobacteria bacterium]